jgi:hypothetical protein
MKSLLVFPLMAIVLNNNLFSQILNKPKPKYYIQMTRRALVIREQKATIN